MCVVCVCVCVCECVRVCVYSMWFMRTVSVKGSGSHVLLLQPNAKHKLAFPKVVPCS